MPRKPDPRLVRLRAELEEEPCETCGASAGAHCKVIGTGRDALFPHAARYDKRRLKMEARYG